MKFTKEERAAIAEALEAMGAAEQVLTERRDELQEKFDDLSETAQDGPRGEKLQEEIDHLQEAIYALDTSNISSLLD